jgi:hypothetical protein
MNTQKPPDLKPAPSLRVLLFFILFSFIITYSLIILKRPVFSASATWVLPHQYYTFILVCLDYLRILHELRYKKELLNNVKQPFFMLDNRPVMRLSPLLYANCCDNIKIKN